MREQDFAGLNQGADALVDGNRPPTLFNQLDGLFNTIKRLEERTLELHNRLVGPTPELAGEKQGLAAHGAISFYEEEISKALTTIAKIEDQLNHISRRL